MQKNTGIPTAVTEETHDFALSLPTCDINLGSPTLPAPEDGDFVELLLL